MKENGSLLAVDYFKITIHSYFSNTQKEDGADTPSPVHLTRALLLLAHGENNGENNG